MTILALALATATAASQDRPDSTKTKPGMQADTSGNMVNAPRKGNDKFIDADGDGICDGRAKGLGLRHGAAKGRAGGNDPATGQKRWRGRRK